MCRPLVSKRLCDFQLRLVAFLPQRSLWLGINHLDERCGESRQMEDGMHYLCGGACNQTFGPSSMARCIEPWKTVRKFDYKRRHKGSAYHPPFVAIRRTSRPGDLFRATATVVEGKQPVAVENHIIVCLPKDGTFKTCAALMAQLKSDKVNKHLDARIRCRHLTVGVVRQIPFR